MSAIRSEKDQAMNRPKPLFLAVAIGLAVTVFAGGCARDDAASYIASAKKYLDQSDVSAAIIQLRNAREKAPDNAEARFLLGKALLESNDPAAAESELRKAEALGYAIDATKPLIAQAMARQGEHRKLLAEFGDVQLSDPVARADVASLVAVSYLIQGNREAAAKAVDAALAVKADHPRALLVRAQLLAMGGKLDEAGRALDAALAGSPNDPDATLAKAELLAAQGKRDDAIKLLSAAVTAKPSALSLRSSLVTLLVGAGNLKGASAEVEAMRRAAPKDVRTVYAEALVALNSRDFAKARELSQALVATMPDHIPSLYLVGLASYQLKSWSAAEDALLKVIRVVPNDPRPHRVLTATYLGSGRVVQAAETSDAALKRFPEDSTLLRLAGEAQILNGNTAGAVRHFERATKLESDGSVARVRLAQVRLAQGDAERAISDLEEIAAADTTATNADLALYSAHMARREYAKALAVVDNLEKKRPGALPHELRGNVAMAKRDYAVARASYAKALEAQPDRLSAARSLARLDLLDNKPADARARYEKMIAADPRNEQLRLALAEVQRQSGASAAEIRATLDKAVADNPASVSARLALINHLRRTGDAAGALAAARAAAAALPESPQVVEVLGVMQLANKEFGQARDTFVRLAELQPRNPAPLLRQGEVFVAQKDYAAALAVQRKALDLQPDSLAAVAAIATTHLASGKPEEALNEAKRIQKQQPDKVVGYGLEAEILIAQKKYPEAAHALQQALARSANPMLAGRYYSTLRAAGRAKEADAFVERWSKDHPKDANFLSLVAQQRQLAKDAAGAVSAYRAALVIEPDNVVALNNLAWMLNEQGKAEARELAERAYRLAPLNPSIVDTLGTVLVAQGDAQRGIAMLRMAVNLSSSDPRLRLNLARALAKTGDKAGAKREAEALMAVQSLPARIRSDAEALLKTL
jgi:putative PEP-CTERM system TPR-repeat lipoprotein